MAELLVNIDVADLEQGVEFYIRAFDLRIARRFGSAAVELLGATAPIYLLGKAPGSTPFAGSGQNRSYQRHWTPVHLDFVVEDLERGMEKAERAGARREREISDHAWGRMAMMADPWGHGFCLIQFTGRGYAEIADPPEE